MQGPLTGFGDLSQIVVQARSTEAQAETRATLVHCLEVVLRALHPFMPFITEELWRVTAEGGPAREGLLVLADWPQLEGLEDADAEAEIGWVIDLITTVRSIRTEINIPPATPLRLELVNAAPTMRERAERWRTTLLRMARLDDIAFSDRVADGAVQLLVRGEVAALPLKGLVDVAAERGRLDKEIAKVDADIKRIDAKLGNADFMARAPEDVVEEQREKREEAEARRAEIAEALERLRHAA